ncbi:hypothetical protein H8959_007125 [Pygathrix nigripes]
MQDAGARALLGRLSRRSPSPSIAATTLPTSQLWSAAFLGPLRPQGGMIHIHLQHRGPAVEDHPQQGYTAMEDAVDTFQSLWRRFCHAKTFIISCDDDWGSETPLRCGPAVPLLSTSSADQV